MCTRVHDGTCHGVRNADEREGRPCAATLRFGEAPEKDELLFSTTTPAF